MPPPSSNGKARTRLTPEARRAQLVQVAGECFAQHAYADVHIEQIADQAGVSVGLIYHHFADKQDLFAAVVDQAIEELGTATEPDRSLEPLAAVRAQLDAYLDYVEHNEYAYRAMHRGTQSGDARVQQALERNTTRQIDRGCQMLLGTPNGPPKLRLAIRGWLGFVIATCLHWLQHHPTPRDELRTLLLHALNGALTGAFAPDEPSDPTQNGSLPTASPGKTATA